MTGVGSVNHAFAWALESTLILPANESATRRVFRNVDPSRTVWLEFGRAAEVGKGVGLRPLPYGKPLETDFRGDVFAISDGPTVMYDSTSVECLLGTPGLAGPNLLVPGQPGVSGPAEMVFGYLDGPNQWSRATWGHVAANGIRKWGNTTAPPGSLTADTDFLDVELDTHVTADQAVTWVIQMRRSGRTPIVYVEPTGPPTWPEVIAAFRQREVEQPHYYIPYWDNQPGFTGYVPELAPYGLADQSTWPAAGVIAKQWQSTLRSVYGQTRFASVSSSDRVTLPCARRASPGSLLRAKIVLSGESDPDVSLGGGDWNLVGKVLVQGTTWLYVFDLLGASGTEEAAVFSWTGQRAATAFFEEFAGWIGRPTRDPNFGGLTRTSRSSAIGASNLVGLATAQQLCTSDIAWAAAPGPAAPLSTPSAFWGPHQTPTLPPSMPALGQASITAPTDFFNCAYYIPPFAASNDLTTEGRPNGWSWKWSVDLDYGFVETNYFDSGASYLQLGWDISSVFVSDVAIQEELG
jgi:hypothetical protein